MKQRFLIALAIIAGAFSASAAVQTLQTTIGASTTQVSTTSVYCRWVAFQNNATHTMRIGDVNTTSSRGIQLTAGASFYVSPAPEEESVNLSSWYVAGTQNDVLDVICGQVNK